MPSSLVRSSGTFKWGPKTTISGPVAATPVIRQLLAFTKTGVASKSKGLVQFGLVSDQSLGKEGYRLHVDRTSIRLNAGSPAGLFYGYQTLRQLLPAALETQAAKGKSWLIPCVDIEDKPRFSWRGLHLDVSRHFFTVTEIKKYLDEIALLKLNVFHWHLVDDGGWRIEIKKYPKLTSVGAWRTELPQWDQSKMNFPGPGSSAKLYGGFYTQEQIKEIVKYAADRYITVVPEIEMPGHTMPSLSAYPELGYSKELIAANKKATGNPIPNVYNVGREETFKFLEDVLDETMALFPSKVIHIGGDEVDKYLWKQDPLSQARRQQEGLKDEHELQSYFIRRIEKYLNSKGRAMMGWDEILEGGLAPNAQVMSWRGESGGIEAANAGHYVVMTPTSPCYFDYTYKDNSTEKVYGYEPIPAAIAPDKAKYVLGAQANVWTEWMVDFKRVEEMCFPRLTAMAETLWLPKEKRDYNRFTGRLAAFSERLNQLKINSMLPVPQVETNTVFLKGPTPIRFANTHYSGVTLRFTVDGTTPTAKSPAYVTPPMVSKPCTVKAAYVANITGQVGDVAAVQCAAAPTPLLDATASRPGLVRTVFLSEFSKVPDFDKLTPTESKEMATIDASDLVGKEKLYAVRFKGYIEIPTDGDWTFSLLSDDGSTLRLGGTLLIDNDGLHSPSTVTATVKLKAGWYPIDLGMFNGGGADAFAFKYGKKGAPLEAVPASRLNQ